MSPSQLAPGKAGKPRTTAAALELSAGGSGGAPQATNNPTKIRQLRHSPDHLVAAGPGGRSPRSAMTSVELSIACMPQPPAWLVAWPPSGVLAQDGSSQLRAGTPWLVRT